jgi:hypothetical protein
MNNISVFPKVSKHLSEERIKKKAFAFLYYSLSFEPTWNITRLSVTLKRRITHRWFQNWEETGPGGRGEWWYECWRCHAWYPAEGGTPTEKTCEEVQKMDPDEVVRAGGR